MFVEINDKFINFNNIVTIRKYINKEDSQFLICIYTTDGETTIIELNTKKKP